MLAGGDHRAGVMLERICFWIKYARMRIPKKPGKWIANDHEFWSRDTRLSRDQLSRTLNRLDRAGLIERTQFWMGHRNVLHVRPTALTLNFLQSATTWKAADELVGLPSVPTESSDLAKLGFVNLQMSNEISKIAEISSVILPIPNNIKTVHDNNHVGLPGASSASPACAANGGVTCQPSSSGKSGINVSSHKSITQLVAVWRDSVNGYLGFDGETLKPSQVGAIALAFDDLKGVVGPEKKCDLRTFAAEIIRFGIKHWKVWDTKGSPDPIIFQSLLSTIVRDWAKKDGSNCLNLSD